MRINKKSWHYRFYSWCCDLDGCSVPEQTNLCDYMWVMASTLLGGLCIAAICIVVLICISFIGIAIYHHPIVALCVVAAFGLVVGAAWFMASNTAELIGDWVYAKKKGVCPIVDFVEGDNNGNQ